MDKLEHFVKKNHHRVLSYFTDKKDHIAFVMILSIYDGVLFMLDLRGGDILFTETGQFQKRYYIEETTIQEFPENLREQPAEILIRDKQFLKDSLKILLNNPMEGGVLILGPGYILDVAKNGSFDISRLMDYPDSLNQYGIFQKYDLEFFYNHKNTISQNVKEIYNRMHKNFLTNLENTKKDWESFSRNPSKHLTGLQNLLVQYNEKMSQYNELKSLTMNMYKLWKQLSQEYDLLGVQESPISFDQSLQLNHKKQMLYKKLDRIKLIEKHATDLLVKIHIICTCIMFYVHILSCELGTIHFKIDKTIEIQDKIQKCLIQTAIHDLSAATMI